MGAFPFRHHYLVANPSVLEFADIATGVIDSLALTIRNTGDVPILMTGQNIIPYDSPFSISFGGGDVEIDSNSAHVMWISFASDDENVFEAVLLIESNEANVSAI